MTFFEEKAGRQDAKREGEDKEPTTKSKTERLVFALAFDDTREGISIAGVEKQGASVNYLLGNDKAGWKTDIPTYKGIVYKGVYKEIDFRGTWRRQNHQI